MKVFWTDFAKKELRNIFAYYSENTNKSVATKLVINIVNETKRLSTQPNLGQREENLKARKQAFRYLVYNNYKIIYWHNKTKNRIEINDVFDCRQDPMKLHRNKINTT